MFDWLIQIFLSSLYLYFHGWVKMWQEEKKNKLREDQRVKMSLSPSIFHLKKRILLYIHFKTIIFVFSASVYWLTIQINWMLSSLPLPSMQPDLTPHISVHVLDFALFVQVSLQVNQVGHTFQCTICELLKDYRLATCGQRSPVMGV